VRAPSFEARSCPVSAYWPQDQPFSFPRGAEEAEMGMLGKAFHKLCVWMGLADVPHPTLGHGWLLLAPVVVRRQRVDADAQLAARLAAKSNA
jgi:hypothetical protein